MKRQNERKETLLYLSSNQTRVFPVTWAGWLLKVHMDSKSDWAKEWKKDPVSPAKGCKGPRHQLGALWGTCRGWGWGAEGRYGLCLCCSVVGTPGTFMAGGSLDGPLIAPCPAVLMVLKWEV